ncbi:MAG TPA: hypothetical protein VMZ91_06845 [Candidatus Paceibacterota bacterium]|nr:hypothetical protein [Candidatus Paceibacterota bacterium]
MVISFYGEPYDIRELEANALTNKVAMCLSNAGYLEEGVLGADFKENFIERCSFNFETEDIYGWGERGQYYVEINFYDFLTDQKNSTIKTGNEALKTDCGLEGKGFPFCLERSLYLLDGEKNHKYQIDILSIVRKTEKNVQ